MKVEKGITLITLVITIIVLIILASVSINLVLGENGILSKAKEAKTQTEISSIKEEIRIDILGKQTENEGNITDTTLKEILEQYGKLSEEGEKITDKTLTTTKGEHEIKVSDIFSGTAVENTTPTIEESEMFSKAIGVIDIVWLNIDNTVRETPLSPAKHLDGLIPIKYNSTTNKEEIVTSPTTDTTWYNYVAQTGNTDGKTSNWANARSSDSNAYFVWIPRYAYKITYFNTEEQAKAYKENGSKEGIIGYSNIFGMVDVKSGTEKLVKDSNPTNVIGKVETSQYADYIPHPAFEFDGSKARNMGRKIRK